MDKLTRQIIGFLSTQENYVTSEYLAERMGVSTKTIYRAIKTINEKNTIIGSQRGLGYLLNSKELSQDQIGTIFTFDQRAQMFQIGTQILLKQPNEFNFIELANQFFLSESALNNELINLNQSLQEFALVVSRQAGRISVNGTESAIRRALNYLLSNQIDLAVDLKQPRQFSPYIDDRDQTFLNEQLDLISTQLDIFLVDPYTINVFLHLYILIERLRQVSPLASTTLTEHVRVDKFYLMAQEIVANIGHYIGNLVPIEEIEDLTLYLSSLRYVSNQSSLLKGASSSYSEWAIQFASYIVNEYPFRQIVDKPLLIEDLAGHLQPMIARIQGRIPLTNPLIHEIKDRYNHVFENLQVIVDRYVEQTYSTDVSDDEIGFLVLYVVNAIDKVQSQKRVLIMCSMGIGTAQLLKTQLMSKLLNVLVIDTISTHAYYQNKDIYNQQADYIISTVAFSQEGRLPYIVVNPILNEIDLKRIREFLNV